MSLPVSPMSIPGAAALSTPDSGYGPSPSPAKSPLAAKRTAQTPRSPGSPSPAERPRGHGRQHTFPRAGSSSSVQQQQQQAPLPPLLPPPQPQQQQPIPSSSLKQPGAARRNSGRVSILEPSVFAPPNAQASTAASTSHRAPLAPRPIQARQHTFPRASPSSPLSASFTPASILQPATFGLASPATPTKGSVGRNGKVARATTLPAGGSPGRASEDASSSGHGHSHGRADSTRSKRKAEDEPERTTPPDAARTGSVRATRFAGTDSRGQKVSEADQTPSAYYRKRIRTSEPLPPSSSPVPQQFQHHPTPPATPRPDADRDSATPLLAPIPVRPTSRGGARPPSSYRSSPPRSPATSVSPFNPAGVGRSSSAAPSDRPSSVPVHAIVSPRPPSVALSSVHGARYHMRDPRQYRLRPTPWTPQLARGGEPASPAHAWAFFAGFVLFPLWWVASVWRVPETRRVGTDAEKGGAGVLVDDPQVEADARRWRTRCRVAGGAALATYVPFVVLVVWFATR